MNDATRYKFVTRNWTNHCTWLYFHWECNLLLSPQGFENYLSWGRHCLSVLLIFPEGSISQRKFHDTTLQSFTMLVDGLAPQSKGGWGRWCGGGWWGGVGGGGGGGGLSGVQGVLLKSRTYILCRSVLKGLIPAFHNLNKYLKSKALHKYGSIGVYL